MSPREILHQLVEELPNADIPTAERVLQALTAARADVEAGRVADHPEVEIRFFPPEHDRSLRGILAPHVRATPSPTPWDEARATAWAEAASEVTGRKR